MAKFTLDRVGFPEFGISGKKSMFVFHVTISMGKLNFLCHLKDANIYTTLLIISMPNYVIRKSLPTFEGLNFNHIFILSLRNIS